MTDYLKMNWRLALWGALFLTLPAAAKAQVSISSISVSNSSPSLGSTISVTVVYCDTANQTPFWLVALNPNSSTMQACPTNNQLLLVDGCTGNTGTSPVTSTQADGSDTCGGNGWGGINVPNTPPPCPYTQVFYVKIPLSAAPGPTNLIVAGGNYYVQCSGGIISTQSTTLNIPLPPAAFTISKRAEGATAAPYGMILFSIDYTYVNTTNFQIWDTVPPNTTLMAVGPTTIASGVTAVGSPAGSPITWSPPSSSPTTQQSGTAWFLVSVNPGVSNGTLITNTASGQTNNVSLSNSNAVTVTVNIPNLVLKKSESATSLSAGSTVTYNLDWTANGQNLQMYDSYDNVAVGNSTSGSAVAWGFDGTNYTVAPAGSPSANGTWTIQSDAQGNHYIDATVGANCSGGAPNQIPELIRNTPGLDICSDFIVEGDLEIPNSTSCPSGADAHMVLACNPSQGITLKAAISIDNNPGNLFIQKNNIYPLPAGASRGVTFPSGSPVTITAGTWYTLRTEIQCSGSGAITYTESVWPKGNPAVAVTLTYIDNTAIQPICSGGWTPGWQVDETSGEDWYSNLKVFGPGPIVNASVTDVIPSGVTYIGASESPVSPTSPLVWNVATGDFPATMYSFDTPINWWGTVACPGPIVNQFSMNASGIPVTTSNPVTLSLSSCSPPPGGCKVLFYYDSTDAVGAPVSNLISVLQAAGASVSVISVTSTGYCPTGDNWSAYNQVWDTRFVGFAQNCPITKQADYFDTCWQSMAATYIQNGGSLYIQGENAGYMSRSQGNGDFFLSIGAVSPTYSDCNTNTPSSTGYDQMGYFVSSTLPGQAAPASFFGWAVGGIPIALLNGTSFVHDPLYATAWSDGTDRSIASGWSGASQMVSLSGPSVGKLFTCWDTTMWTGSYYGAGAGVTETTTNNFFTAVYQWMGGTSCSTPTGTPTVTPTSTPTPVITNTPTLTPTTTPTSTPTISPTPANTATFTPTPAGLHVWPNPYDPQFAVGGVLKAYQVPAGATMGIYTVSGELVIKMSPDSTGLIKWNGCNSNGTKVSSGIYYYVIKNGDTSLLNGKILVLMDH